MTIWQAICRSYQQAAAFMRAHPWLLLVPISAEMAQHAAEMYIGMYDSTDMAIQVENHPLRMGIGMIKILAISFPVYWVARFISAKVADDRVTKFEQPAARLFGIYLLVMTAISAAQLFLLSSSASAAIFSMVLGMIFTSLLIGWAVAAPLGHAEMGPVQSTQLMWRHIPATIVITFIAIMPLMIPHYLLAAAAIHADAHMLKWGILIIDSLLVGWLSILISSSFFFAAARAARLSPSWRHYFSHSTHGA
ncbi:hypothetical protein ACFOWX_00820 [Sphingorhabdus arenilitoris]|uniref:Uncharacterized protein n=1 Tax=Sphingorhabdus arenilitoris TaxID=1490041 RepID=A0ABV8RFF3_9SPHN